MTKILGIILGSMLTVILVVQINQVRAQEGDQPITGPLTSPLTAPLLTIIPTGSVTPTPTLINTLTATPIPTETITPTVTPIPTVSPTATPTPVPAGYSRLGGLNLEGYCLANNNPWDIISNGIWYCGNGSSPIDMTAACHWQYSSNAVAFQDRAGDVYAWSCYGSSVTPSPTEAEQIPTPTITPTVTPTTTPSEQVPTVSITPEPKDTVTPTESLTPVLTSSTVQTDHKEKKSHRSFFFFPKRFSFTAFLAAKTFFSEFHMNKQNDIIKANACSIHDKK